MSLSLSAMSDRARNLLWRRFSSLNPFQNTHYMVTTALFYLQPIHGSPACNEDRPGKLPEPRVLPPLPLQVLHGRCAARSRPSSLSAQTARIPHSPFGRPVFVTFNHDTNLRRVACSAFQLQASPSATLHLHPAGGT